MLPVLTYGAVMWGLMKRAELRLRTVQRAMERKMISAVLRDMKNAVWVRVTNANLMIF